MTPSDLWALVAVDQLTDNIKGQVRVDQTAAEPASQLSKRGAAQVRHTMPAGAQRVHADD